MLSVEKTQTLIDWFINMKKGHRDGLVGEGYASELADLIEPWDQHGGRRKLNPPDFHLTSTHTQKYILIYTHEKCNNFLGK